MKEISPNTVRMLLTGSADLNAAIQAVNQGNIFRFLTKPCSSDALLDALKTGLREYRLSHKERKFNRRTRRLDVQLAAGLVYERLHDKKRAEKHFRQALKANAESPEAQNALGAFLCRNGQHDKGEAMFLKAARNQLYRTPVVAYTNAGVCARSAGDLDRAERYLRQALNMHAGYPETYAQLAGVMADGLQDRIEVGSQRLKSRADALSQRARLLTERRRARMERVAQNLHARACADIVHGALLPSGRDYPKTPDTWPSFVKAFSVQAGTC
mgnify:CR=1 FL=1